MGTPIGALLGLVMGGIVADAYGWRAAFLVAACRACCSRRWPSSP
jgi:predicted MFS family arabinose efflux permease